ncbi:MAG TPA: hypothetical protein PKX87_08475 [Alphaproteobacteria bacterium]|nr:hypothetical protein [Alphaproteobacteria bacterium]
MTTALMFVLALNGGLYLGTILHTAMMSDSTDRPDNRPLPGQGA